MRRMSFHLTQSQLVDGSKTVTRRLGWDGLKVGERFLAVDKCMGLKKGEKSKVLAELVVVSVRKERLDSIDQQDVVREGFPSRTPSWFVEFFCRSMRCDPGTVVNRIQFRRAE